MSRFSRKVVRFLRDEEGPTTVEYAMAGLLVLLTVLTTIVVLGRAAAPAP